MTKKICRLCNTEKDIKDFGKSLGYVRGECKTCRNKQAKHYRSSSEGKETISRYHYDKKYNLSLEEYNSKVERQDSRCKICGKRPDKKLVVDRNHTTGDVRDLLCSNCNTMIGLAKENPYILQSAMNYLFLHNT